MSNYSKYVITYIAGLVFCILPVVITTVEYFPLWIQKSPQTFFSGFCVSGFSLAIITIVALPPVIRSLKQKFKDKTPAAWLGFLIAAIAFKLVSSVADALYVIFVVAALGNFIGMMFFRFSQKYKKLHDKEVECDDRIQNEQ